jgi:hypothetical protein
MLEILEGSIVTGKSGKPLKVISIDGDGLVLESDTGVVKAKRSAIVRIISAPLSKPTPPPVKVEQPPEATTPLAVGDTVYYCGDRYWEQYRDMSLVLFELREGLWICEKPDKYRTTNLPAKELSRLPVDRPKVTASRNPQKGQWLKDWESEQRRK